MISLVTINDKDIDIGTSFDESGGDGSSKLMLHLSKPLSNGNRIIIAPVGNTLIDPSGSTLNDIININSLIYTKPGEKEPVPNVYEALLLLKNESWANNIPIFKFPTSVEYGNSLFQIGRGIFLPFNDDQSVERGFLVNELEEILKENKRTESNSVPTGSYFLNGKHVGYDF